MTINTYAAEVAQACTEVRAHLEECEQDLCLRDIRREPYADEQAYLIAALLRKLACVAHHAHTRSTLTDAAGSLDSLAADLAQLRREEEAEFERAMSTASGRRAVREGMD